MHKKTPHRGVFFKRDYCFKNESPKVFVAVIPATLISIALIWSLLLDLFQIEKRHKKLIESKFDFS
jgi:hypothetical protein